MTSDGHEKLAAALDARSLSFPVEPDDAAEEDPFDADPDAAPEPTFPQSVASGGPESTGVVVWTRIDPEAYREDQPLGIEVAHDPDFDEVVYRGTVAAEHVTPEHDYAVSVDLLGLLDPDRFYHYRFTYDGVRSRVGRCHTLPAADASPDSLRLAVLTCQDYTNGYYGAYHRVAEEDVDFVVHVGDFIYESVAGDYKGLGSPDLPDRDLELPSGHDLAWTLEDYRYLYRAYRSDEYLQEALERHTIIAARDDHEFTDNVHWDPDAGAPRGPEHPRGRDPEFMLGLAADALTAWWEYMPSRIGYDPTADSFGERYRLWQSFAFGDLVDVVMTDERLYRDPPRNADNHLPAWFPLSFGYDAPERSMLGDDQREWFLDEVRDSEATWTVWSDEVLTVPFRVGVGPLTLHPSESGWDGYGHERRLITDEVARADIENFVTLTGDMHCYIASYQQTTYENPFSHVFGGEPANTDHRVGVEFMTPAITSVTVSEGLGASGGLWGSVSETLLSPFVRAQNPHIEFFDSHHWGYSVVEFTPEECTYTAYSVDKLDDSSDPDTELMVALRVPEGRVEIQDRSLDETDV